MNRLSQHFSESAVIVTGQTPTDKRQSLVDRFQKDERIRVYLANIIAGGIGTNLTAATQVVFNDLDWVPANHWQAEDRAYRIGQTRTVNVTYMIASNTIDDFVQSVLQRKGALVSAVVDGKALVPNESGDVLDELQRAQPARAAARGSGQEARWRRSRGLPADRDAADESPSRSFRAAPARRSSAGAQLSLLRETLLCG